MEVAVSKPADRHHGRTAPPRERRRDYLIQVVEGPGPYITARGFGEDVPLVDGTSQAAFARIDRIEIVVSEADVPVTRFDLAYVAALDCWGPAGGDTCGVIERGFVREADTRGDAKGSRPRRVGAPGVAGYGSTPYRGVVT